MQKLRISHAVFPETQPSHGGALSRTRLTIGTLRMAGVARLQIQVALRPVRTIIMLTPDWEELCTHFDFRQVR
jgi:hypothetical protein